MIAKHAGLQCADRSPVRSTARSGAVAPADNAHLKADDHEGDGDTSCCQGPLAQRVAVGPITDASLFGESGPRGFMAELRSRLTQACNEELAPSGRTADDCPYLAHWLDHYDHASASHLDRAIQRYAQPAERSSASYLEAVEARVRTAVRKWVTTGTITDVPDESLSSSSGPGEEADAQHSPGTGRPLDGSVRSKLESSYSADLGGVRVHTDGRAASMAKQMSALAFTVGRDISFASGRYRPGTMAGDALIAHEVAHTIQQGGSAHRATEVGTSDEAALEHDADAAAARAVAGQPAAITRSVGRGGGLKLQRCSSADCTRYGPSGLRLDLEKKRKCGLLDPPFRPEDVGTFPDYAPEDDLSNRRLDDSCYPRHYGPRQPIIAGLGPRPPVAALGFFEFPVPLEPPVFEPIPMPPIEPIPLPPIEPIPLPPIEPIPMPPIEPPIMPEPIPAPPTSPWLRPLPPIPPVVPVPGEPRPSPTAPRADDQRYLDRLTPRQKEYYRELRDAERQKAPDRAENPDEIKDTEPSEEPERRRRRPKCREQDVPRLGGYVAHDRYASLKSGSDFDHFAAAPRGPKINYDGRTPGSNVVWEVKVGGGWMYNCDYQSLKEIVLSRWDAQKDRGMAVAARCGLSHVWACQHRGVARIVRARWGGNPPVVT